MSIPIERLLGEPAGADVQVKGRHLSATVAGKVFAYTRGSDVILKLPAARVDELRGAGTGSRLVMGSREMPEWAVVPLAAGSEVVLGPLLAEAAEFVSGR